MFSPLEWEALRLSLRVAALSTLISLPAGLLVAWLLSRARWPGKALLDTLVHAPLVLPPVVIGYLLLISLGTRAPLGRWLQEHFGVQLIFTTAGAVTAAAVMSFPLMVRAMRLSLDAVDRGLEVAARTLGATRLDAFLSITLPLMLPGILSGSMMAFAASLGEFGATITFASNIEGETRTLPLAIYTATQTPDGDRAALRLVGLSMALAVTALLASGWLERRTRRWLSQP
ncbi:molybdate ABC transporter permease subunit [Aquabacterium sp. A7-Y]|uniref:molybdate ABC transporter permease subunit n=1 Tax=Aquabacterium sp. A7-Y TaxID=1349605 RepID=UPI00223D0A95|nr:molybdate ABC transporter permease subunit [Aquabacterium sp. A7-Y]MCW7541976.1 molybdate ABC transporter permease subunit [Aquabacterium sp. A7-Y]